MGKQYKKIVKRRRRAAYLARRKAALQEGKPKAKKPAKAAPVRASRKPVTKKANPEVEEKKELAEKANVEDMMIKSVDKTTFYYLTKKCLFQIPSNMKPDTKFMVPNGSSTKGECKLGSGKQEKLNLDKSWELQTRLSTKIVTNRTHVIEPLYEISNGSYEE